MFVIRSQKRCGKCGSSALIGFVTVVASTERPVLSQSVIVVLSNIFISIESLCYLYYVPAFRYNPSAYIYSKLFVYSSYIRYSK